METQGQFVIQMTLVCDLKVIRCIETMRFFSLLQVPPRVNLSGPDRPVTEGDNVILTCNIIDGVPKPNLICWLKDKTSLDVKDTNLVLRGIKKEQEGTYTCETSSEGGSANDSIKVIVDSKTY